jgi:hypothetical protein
MSVPPQTEKKRLKQFAAYLKNHCGYTRETIAALVGSEWDGAYPASCIGDDDLLRDIAGFLYDLGAFARETVFPKADNLDFQIVTDPSYDDRSGIYLLELKTKTVVAYDTFKTYNITPEFLAEILTGLIAQLEKSKDLLGIRKLVDETGRN